MPYWDYDIDIVREQLADDHHDDEEQREFDELDRKGRALADTPGWVGTPVKK